MNRTTAKLLVALAAAAALAWRAILLSRSLLAAPLPSSSAAAAALPEAEEGGAGGGRGKPTSLARSAPGGPGADPLDAPRRAATEAREGAAENGDGGDDDEDEGYDDDDGEDPDGNLDGSPLRHRIAASASVAPEVPDAEAAADDRDDNGDDNGSDDDDDDGNKAGVDNLGSNSSSRQRTSAFTHNATAAASAAPPTVAYVCIASPPTYATRGSYVLKTWASTVRPPHRFAFAAASALPDLPPDGNVVAWIPPGDPIPPTREGAQSLFWTVLLSFPLRENEWLMIVDDDAFVITYNLEELATSSDPNVPAAYGQITCKMRRRPKAGTHLCGGGGALWSPRLISALRSDAVEARVEAPGGGGGEGSEGGSAAREGTAARSRELDGAAWDKYVSDRVRARKLGRLVHVDGFRSQPPAWYEGERREGEPGPPEKPVTFHYVDGERQRKKKAQLGCGECPEVYTSLFEKYYGVEGTASNERKGRR